MAVEELNEIDEVSLSSKSPFQNSDKKLSSCDQDEFFNQMFKQSSGHISSEIINLSKSSKRKMMNAS